MIEIKLGERYAKSVFQLAQERGELEKIKEDFSLILTVCDENKDFLIMLRSPLVPPDKKSVVIQKIFNGKLSTITFSFIQILVRKGREPWLRDIAICFLGQYDRAKNVTRGVITSSHPLSSEMKDRIKALVEKEMKTSFVLEEKTDPELIGGFILRIGDFQYDGTVASGLRRLEQQFSKNPYVGEFDVDIA